MAFVEFADVSKIYQMGEVKVAAVRDMSFTLSLIHISEPTRH